MDDGSVIKFLATFKFPKFHTCERLSLKRALIGLTHNHTGGFVA